MIDINRAVRHPFEDKNWVSTLLLGALINAVPILNFAGTGWMAEHAANSATVGDVPMPNWGQEFGRKFVNGLKLFVVSIGYSLPIILASCFFTFAAGGLAAATSNSRNASDAVGAGIGFLSLCLGCFGLIYGILLVYITPSLIMQFVKSNYDLMACFRFGEVFALTRRNTADYLMIFIVMIVASFAIGLIVMVLGIIPFIGICLTIPISILLTPYLYAVLGQMCGQYMRQHAAV